MNQEVVFIVDFVKLKIHIPPENIKKSEWKKRNYNNNGWESEWCFANKGKVKLKYSDLSQNLYIEGRIINLITKSYYLNFDDFENEELIIDSFYDTANKYINTKLTNFDFDISKMKVTQIEYSFNIKYACVSEYVEFLNYLYVQNTSRKYRNYADYTVKKGEDPTGSFYYKTNGDYKKNSFKNFCINIYNKPAQLKNKRDKNISDYHKSYVKNKDIQESSDILRIECKVGYEYRNRICNIYNIEPTFENLFNKQIAKEATIHQLNRCFGAGDFYSKKSAEKIIADNNLKINLDIPISELSEYKYGKFKKNLEHLGICPYGFIPEEWGIEKLDNPINLILNKK